MNEEQNKKLSFKQKFAVIAFICFGLSAITNLFSLFGINIARYFPFIYFLHIALIFIVLASLISIRYFHYRRYSDGAFGSWFLAPIPKAMRYLLLFLFIYMILNFVLSFFLERDGISSIVDGKYVLEQGGRAKPRRIIRELTESEYDWRQSHVMRMSSSLWMWLSLMAAFYFWYPRKDTNPEIKTND